MKLFDQGPQKRWCSNQPLKNEQSLDRQRKGKVAHSILGIGARKEWSHKVDCQFKELLLWMSMESKGNLQSG